MQSVPYTHLWQQVHTFCHTICCWTAEIASGMCSPCPVVCMWPWTARNVTQGLSRDAESEEGQMIIGW